jgi:thioredoxin reductase
VYDVLIVGGGPAGLNAALVLGRCRRTVLVCDADRPRNACSQRVSGFLTRDGVVPAELRRLAREQLEPYTSVEVRETEVEDARAVEDGFELDLPGGERVRGRKLLLATGLLDDLPEIEGFGELYGKGVYHCPYCDGWEHRDDPMAVYGQESRGVGLALEMLIWSRDVVLCTDGPANLSDEDRDKLERHGIPVIETKVARLESDGGGAGRCETLKRVHFADGSSLDRRSLFFVHGERMPSGLVRTLGCELTHGVVKTHSYERTNIPGLYVAGDASRRVQFAVVAAAEGAMAAFAMNSELLEDDLASGALELPPEARGRSAGSKAVAGR